LASLSRLAATRAITTIYIQADGSFSPVTAPIKRTGDLYTLTGDIDSDADGIVIQKNNTILDGAGHRLLGANISSSNGIYLLNDHNVTIKNITIDAFDNGILLDSYSTLNTIFGNKVEGNNYGINCWAYADNNSIIGNNITDNSLAGIWFVGSSNDTVIENIIRNSQYGVTLDSSSNNVIYHNEFVENTNQISIYDSTDAWDNGYPSGGNHWSDYTGNDVYSGTYQNETGSDGIGDTPYNISDNNQDRYPLIQAWTNIAVETVSLSKTVIWQGENVTITVSVQNQGWDGQTTNITVYANTTIVSTFKNMALAGRSQTTLNFTWQTGTFALGNYTISAKADPVSGETVISDNAFQGRIILTIKGDINGDGAVDIYDAIILSAAFNSSPSSPNWNPNADVNSDGSVDIYDAIILSSNFGKKI
jgi:parallel beta-helix repeat protein